MASVWTLELANQKLKSIYSEHEFEHILQEQDKQKSKAILELKNKREENEHKTLLSKLTVLKLDK